jgi:hypothetical protein
MGGILSLGRIAMFYTWKDIVKKSGLKIPMSTSNNYRDEYLQYFEYEQTGRHPKYSERSVDVLIDIVKLIKQRKSQEEIKEVLESKYGAVAELIVQDQHSCDTSITNQQAEFMEAMRNIFKEEMQRLEGKLDDVLNDNKSHDEKLTKLIRLKQDQQQEKKKFFKWPFGNK